MRRVRRVSPLPNRAFDYTGPTSAQMIQHRLGDFEAHAEALQPCREGPAQVMQPPAGNTRVTVPSGLHMHAAFRRGGRTAIDKVMKQQPAVFLKLLVLLVPRELQVEHRGGVKAMSDDDIERAIEMIQSMLAAKEAGANAKVIEGETTEVAALPPPESKTRKKRKRTQDVVVNDAEPASK